MSNELAHARLALAYCEWWQPLKAYRLNRRIKELEAIDKSKPWRRKAVIEGITPSCNG